MSERCLHCILRDAIEAFAAERIDAGRPATLGEAAYALGAVYRDLVAGADASDADIAASLFTAASKGRPPSVDPSSDVRVH